MLTKKIITDVEEIQEVLDEYESMTLERLNVSLVLNRIDFSSDNHYGMVEWYNDDIAVMKNPVKIDFNMPFNSDKSRSELRTEWEMIMNKAVLDSDRIPIDVIDEENSYIIVTRDFIEQNQYCTD